MIAPLSTRSSASCSHVTNGIQITSTSRRRRSCTTCNEAQRPQAGSCRVPRDCSHRKGLRRCQSSTCAICLATCRVAEPPAAPRAIPWEPCQQSVSRHSNGNHAGCSPTRSTRQPFAGASAACPVPVISIHDNGSRTSAAAEGPGGRLADMHYDNHM